MHGLIKNFASNFTINDIKNEIKLRQNYITVNNIVIKEERLTCWMSDSNYEYKYGSKIMEPDILSSNIKKIQKLILDNYGYYYDSVLINYYENGTVGMRYHSDNIYDEWNEDTVVVSFGSSRKVIFREIDNYDNKIYYDIDNGDLLYMKEKCQERYQHKVAKDKNIKDERISLVFKSHI